MLWFAVRTVVLLFAATFELERVSPFATSVVRSSVCGIIALIQRVIVALKARTRVDVTVPDGIILIPADDLTLVFDVLAFMSIYDALTTVFVVPSAYTHITSIAAASSLLNCVFDDIPNKPPSITFAVLNETTKRQLTTGAAHVVTRRRNGVSFAAYSAE